MANSDNKCHALEVNYDEKASLSEMLNIQASLQEKIMPGFYNSENSLRDIADFFIKNKHALDDEMNETIDAIGGISDGIGSGAWKWWKKDYHEKAGDLTLKDLSPSDLLELKFEVVDQFHFFMNQMIKLGIGADELSSLYIAKNRENFNRQERGY